MLREALMDSLVLVGLVFVAFAIAVLLEIRRKRAHREHHEIRSRSEAAGLNEPHSLHPVINASRCIGSGACMEACPEQKVIGLVGGKATLIQGAKCVGHGRCADECPTGAIRLVFGTLERGVDLPSLSSDYETNVHGLFIVGELGGMGLVRNAVRQGALVMNHIAELVRERPSEAGMCDVAIVGAGPAGVAAAVRGRAMGLDVRLLEREPAFGGSVLHYPREKIIASQPMDVPGYGPVKALEIPKQTLLDILKEALEKGGVEPLCGHGVTAVTPLASGEAYDFELAFEQGGSLRARSVVLAIGRRGMPRKLEVPGEELSKVAYALREVEVYSGQRVLVVGGGNSAIEAALGLSADPTIEVTLSYRGRVFSRITDKNDAALERAVNASRVRVLRESSVKAITETTVTLALREGELELQNDAVLVFAGGTAPKEFLERAGVRMDTHYGLTAARRSRV